MNNSDLNRIMLRLKNFLREFDYGGRRYERKVSFRHNGDFRIVRFNNKKYYLYEYECDPYSRNPGYRQLIEMNEEYLELLNDLKFSRKYWSLYKRYLEELI